MSVASVLVAVGVISNAHDALSGPLPSQRVSPITLACYLVVLVLVLWALLRLPTWHRSGSDWARFALDACVMLITSGIFVWHFSLRNVALWTQQTGSALPLLAIVVVACVSVITFVKVAFAGAGHLDRRAIAILAYGTAISAVFGGMSPFLVHRPYLSSSFVAVAVATFSIQLAARRQFCSNTDPPKARPRSRRLNIVPYIAVVATDILLLSTGTGDPAETVVVQSASVALTALVVARQIVTLVDNTRLLTTVDGNLNQLRQYQELLEHQATHDALTGVANRAGLEQAVTELLSSGTPFHMALLDLDDFKTVNDRLGHGMGDLLLTTLSARLQGAIRQQDTVARLGGDEFVAILCGSDSHDLTAVLTRLVASVQEPILLNGYTTISYVSIGVTESRTDDQPQELLRRADVAMYAAKTAGGNRWTWFDPIMDQLADHDVRLSNDLRQAIAGSELFLMYQPIIELPHGGLAGVETLLRWRHPQHGLVSPAVFIPLAERNGSILDIGRWVMEQACQQAAGWRTLHGDNAPAKVSINVSARQLAEPGFVSDVAEILDRTGVDRQHLMIEVTETAVLSTDTALDAVRDLHHLGLQIALDDFGTGNSSLSLLATCPVDVLKVDKSFVDGITADTPQAVIVRNLINITEDLHIQAVAEGVETAEQAEQLHKAGYRYVQGFHYARPTSPDDITAMIVNARKLVTPSHTP